MELNRLPGLYQVLHVVKQPTLGVEGRNILTPVDCGLLPKL